MVPGKAMMTDLQPMDEKPWRPADLPAKTLKDRRETLRRVEAKLARAHEARHEADRKVRAAADSGDRRELPRLNRAAVEAGRKVTELEQQLVGPALCAACGRAG